MLSLACEHSSSFVRRVWATLHVISASVLLFWYITDLGGPANQPLTAASWHGTHLDPS
jgi:hypothetical protein